MHNRRDKQISFYVVDGGYATANFVLSCCLKDKVNQFLITKGDEMSIKITTPVGRLIEGNVHKAYVYSSNKGTEDFFFAVAIPKGKETHWNQTEWGKAIYEEGQKAFPDGQWQRPDFSWKIIDGDSTLFNGAKLPVRWCDKEGYASNWVLKFARPFAPTIYNHDGSQQILEENYINLGDYVQVYAQILGNQDKTKKPKSNVVCKPGVYLNHESVALSAYGPRMMRSFASDPSDATAAGFGRAPLPPGASTVPLTVSTTASPVQQQETAPPTPNVPPYPQVLEVPPAPTPPIPAAPTYVMTDKAKGRTQEEFRKVGWTDAQMIEHGIMVVQ
jgi:hypothetical protein